MRINQVATRRRTLINSAKILNAVDYIRELAHIHAMIYLDRSLFGYYIWVDIFERWFLDNILPRRSNYVPPLESPENTSRCWDTHFWGNSGDESVQKTSMFVLARNNMSSCLRFWIYWTCSRKCGSGQMMHASLQSVTKARSAELK